MEKTTEKLEKTLAKNPRLHMFKDILEKKIAKVGNKEGVIK